MKAGSVAVPPRAAVLEAPEAVASSAAMAGDDACMTTTPASRPFTLSFTQSALESEYLASEARSRWPVLVFIFVFDVACFLFRLCAKWAAILYTQGDAMRIGMLLEVGKDMGPQLANMLLLHIFVGLFNGRSRKLGITAVKQEEILLSACMAVAICSLLYTVTADNASDYVYAAYFLICTSTFLKIRWWMGTLTLAAPASLAAAWHLTSRKAILSNEALVHIFVAWAVGGLMAYLSEWYRRQMFASQKMAATAHRMELREAQARIKAQRQLAAAQAQAAHRALTVAREKASNEAKSDFMSLMCHEVRTPLNGCLASAEMLLETPLEQEQRELAKTICVSGSILLSTVSNFLDFFKLEAGKALDVVRTEVNLPNLVSDVHCIIDAMVGRESGVRLLEPDMGGAARNVLCDPDRVRGILLNLYTNAAKFTKRGHIQLRVTEVNGDFVPHPPPDYSMVTAEPAYPLRTSAVPNGGSGGGGGGSGPTALRVRRQSQRSTCNAGVDLQGLSPSGTPLAGAHHAGTAAFMPSAASGCADAWDAATAGGTSVSSAADRADVAPPTWPGLRELRVRAGSGAGEPSVAPPPQLQPPPQRAVRNSSLGPRRDSGAANAEAVAAVARAADSGASPMSSTEAATRPSANERSHAAQACTAAGSASPMAVDTAEALLLHGKHGEPPLAAVASPSGPPDGGSCVAGGQAGAAECGEPAARWLLFEVQDTGIGIGPDGLKALFKEYVQGTDDEMKKPRTKGGTGLGLSICSKQVGVLGGRIGAYSCLGRGSVFWFTMPLQHAEAQTAGRGDGGDACVVFGSRGTSTCDAGGRSRRASSLASGPCSSNFADWPGSGLGGVHGRASVETSGIGSASVGNCQGVDSGVDGGADGVRDLDATACSLGALATTSLRREGAPSCMAAPRQGAGAPQGAGPRLSGGWGHRAAAVEAPQSEVCCDSLCCSCDEHAHINVMAQGKPPAVPVTCDSAHGGGAAAAEASGPRPTSPLLHGRSGDSLLDRRLAQGMAAFASCPGLANPSPSPHGSSSAAHNGLCSPRTSHEGFTVRGLRALLVEDNLINQTVARKMLHSLGMHCEVAANGLEALHAIERTLAGVGGSGGAPGGGDGAEPSGALTVAPFDVVLMDMSMPVMGGVDATRAIRRLGCAVPILAMTANASEKDRDECQQCGMDGFLSKPVLKDRLSEAIEHVLQSCARVSGTFNGRFN
uniref:histidine kinase n=1 Tax=Chlamydomonas euryale TaxID=1486919 RepID=A0A7R9VZ96_9CHLO|mmetsp:Transcript_7746/g.23273  ORF Transcript_7746/g.23273 Transcript_7746/m.23273 type:complete len:1207 (+) Transcript_7746:141-3761(+)